MKRNEKHAPGLFQNVFSYLQLASDSPNMVPTLKMLFLNLVIFVYMLGHEFNALFRLEPLVFIDGTVNKTMGLLSKSQCDYSITSNGLYLDDSVQF